MTRKVRFGQFTLDVRTGELDSPAGRERLQDLPLRVLTVLLDNAGDLVSRDQLRRAVWPGDTLANFDNALWTVMKKLRRALGDDAGAPCYLETLPKKGYRFVADVEPIGEEIRPPNGPLSVSSLIASFGVGEDAAALVERLQDENRRLRSLVAELSLECERLREYRTEARVAV